VPTAPGLILYGLYSGDEVCVQAGVESLKWALDGRWAIRDKDGLKQSEQLLNTRWYYNTFFAQRGDFRRGMPLWGRTDSEHGWPQVIPTSAFLGTGQLMVDWPRGRAVAVDNRQVENMQKEGDTLTLTLSAVSAESATGGLFVRVVRLEAGDTFSVEAAGRSETVSVGQLAHGYILREPGPEGYRLVLRRL
jgi:hypothetical protein